MSGERKKLAHEGVGFGQYGEEGRTYVIVHDGDDRLHLGMSSSGRGIGISLVADLAPADVDKLIDLLQRGVALVRADIERRATLPLPVAADDTGPAAEPTS